MTAFYGSLIQSSFDETRFPPPTLGFYVFLISYPSSLL